MAYGNQSKRNDIFEVLNRTPGMFALLEKAEEAIDEIECKFMLDEDVSKTIEKIKKHLGKLDTQFSRMQNEAIREYKLLKL